MLEKWNKEKSGYIGGMKYFFDNWIIFLEKIFFVILVCKYGWWLY